MMGAAEARTHLLENHADLYVSRTWGLTQAGTPFVLLRWGYSEGNDGYVLHVHGTRRPNGTYKRKADDSDIKIAKWDNRGGVVYLSTTQYTLIRASVDTALRGSTGNWE
jgi:hypothetical protein